MEFNIINENNQFKLGNIISIFKIDNNNRDFALFSIGDYDGDKSDLYIAYLNKDNEGYDYIESIEDENILKQAMEAVKDMMETISK